MFRSNSNWKKKEINVASLVRDFKEFIKKRGRYNVFTEKINKIALSSNIEKRMQWIDLIEIYEYGTSIDLVSKKERIKCNNIIIQYKDHWLINLLIDDVTK